MLRSFYILQFLLSCSFFVAAQSVHFEPSLQIAFEKAAQQNKLVFVEYYNADCPICKKLEPVFNDSTLSKFYNEHFINYKLNTENIKKEDSLFITQTGLKFESVPWFLFFDTDKNLVHYAGTKPDVTYLNNIGTTALNTEERSAALAGKYAAGDRSIKTLYAYSNLLQLYKNDSLRTILADQLFSVFPKDQLGTEKSYIITKNAVTNIDNGFFLYWINHTGDLKVLEQNAASAHPVNVLGNIILKSINSAERKNWGLQKIKAVKEMIVKSGLGNDPDAFFWEQEAALLVKEQRTAEASQLFKQQIAADSSDINTSAYTINYFLYILTDKSNLNTIKSFIDKLSLKKVTPEEKGKLLYSNILFYKQSGDIATARKLGLQATTFYKANKLDSQALGELLKGL
jgi:hypothetical protein